MPFDVEKLVINCEAAIDAFAGKHREEHFYAFAIDASMLCLNSIERFESTLKRYQDRWERQTRWVSSPADMTELDWRDEDFLLGLEERHGGLDRSNKEACVAIINESRERRRREGCEYLTEAGILALKMNTGDWDYQGFADLSAEHGFDSGQYDEHYYAAMESDDGHASSTAYAKAMTLLVELLKQRNAFESLAVTTDFWASWVDHSY